MKAAAAFFSHAMTRMAACLVDANALGVQRPRPATYPEPAMRAQVRNNLFEPVVAAFLANGPRYNLLNSAVLELFEFIRRENMKPLIAHLCEAHAPKLAQADYVDTFRQLQLKHEQNKVPPWSPPKAPPRTVRTPHTGDVAFSTMETKV